MTDRIYNIFNPPLRRTDDYTIALDEACRRMAAATRTPYDLFAKPPQSPRKGDKVEVVLTGYVESVSSEGHVTLVDKRTPFKDEAKFVGVGPAKSGDGFTVRVVERAPVEPKVGDTISGRLLKDTPWKRGTLISVVRVADAKYALGIDGKWTNVNSGQRFGFDAFSDYGRYLVEYAPGK